jgi:hypothetical protein
MKRILSVIAVLVQLTLLAQNNLTIKAGVERDYRVYQQLNISTDNANFDFTAGGAISSILSLQIGGRFGTDQVYEGGIGLGLGSMSLASDDAKRLASEIFRKGIYVERFYSSSRRIVLGTGSQLYTYKIRLERDFDKYWLSNNTLKGIGTWRAIGLECKLIARLYFDENEGHSLQCFFSLSGERFALREFELNNEKTQTNGGGVDLNALPRLGISYAIVFNQRR